MIEGGVKFIWIKNDSLFGDCIMPFKTGSWGEQAKARSKRRLDYFKEYSKRRQYKQGKTPKRRKKRTYKDRNEYARNYYLKNREKKRKYYRNYYREHRDKILQRQYHRFNSPKERKRNQVRAYADRHSSLGESCEKCGTKEGLERHHPSYDKPLVFLTLCHSCHRRLHQKATGGNELND